MADPQQNYRNVLSRLEAQDKEGTNLQDVYDFLSLMPGTGDVIGAYEAPGIIKSGIEKMGEEGLSEKAKGVGIAALGTMGMIPLAGKPARAAAKVFSKIDTPVYHFTVNPGFTKFDKEKLAIYDLGPHVGSTPKGAADRMVMQVGDVEKGGSIPLKADLSKPLLNPNTKKPFTEEELMDFKVIKLKSKLGDSFTKDDLLLETDNFDVKEIRKAVSEVSQDLAKEGFTHIPYYNAYEDIGELSYEMLVDRPKGSTKVLQSPFAKKDPDKFDDADFMMQEGGVVSMKDKAVNMNRGPRGIEPFVQYFENGGIVQSVKDYIGGFFEEEPIVPERNVFEEQRIVAENSPYPKDIPMVQTEKEALSDLADREMGLELLSKFSFDPMAYKIMQAGLRDNRPLSDFVKIYPTLTKAERQKMSQEAKKRADLDKFAGLGLAMGVYRPLDNMIMVEPMREASEYFQSPTDMIITHELLHKGAETLKKDPNVNIKSLREMLDADDYKNIGDDTERGRAEHRYIQAITNQAFVDDMLQQTASYGLRGIVEAEKILKDPKSSSLAKKDARRQIKQIPKYIARDQKLMLVDEIRRSTNLYMEDFDKEVFKKNVEIILPNSKIFDYYLTYDDKKEISKKFTLKQLKQVFDLTNMIMLNQPATKDFALEMSKAAPAGASIRGYSDLFPRQFADPVKPYERPYLGIGPDATYFDVMRARNKFLEKKAEERKNENKAEGGVIGLKDKAVNMYRNRL